MGRLYLRGQLNWRRAKVSLVTREALLEPAAGSEISLEEWSALPEDEPGEVVDGHLDEMWAAVDRLPAEGPPPSDS